MDHAMVEGHVVGESAVALDGASLESFAQIGPTSRAEVTVAAAQVRVHDDSHSRRHPGEPFAGLLDDPAELMSRAVWVLPVSAASPYVKV